MRAPGQGPAADREAALLASTGVDQAAWEKLGPIAEGTRRPLTVPVGDPSVEPGPDPDSLRVAYSLPSGAYATVLMGELSDKA